MDLISLAVGFGFGLMTAFGFFPMLDWAKKSVHKIRNGEEL